eukprot:140025-Hanusia_phi.AAC.1
MAPAGVRHGVRRSDGLVTGYSVTAAEPGCSTVQRLTVTRGSSGWHSRRIIGVAESAARELGTRKFRTVPPCDCQDSAGPQRGLPSLEGPGHSGAGLSSEVHSEVSSVHQSAPLLFFSPVQSDTKPCPIAGGPIDFRLVNSNSVHR